MIDFRGGMIFPDRYDRDQPDGPDPCDECEGEGVIFHFEDTVHNFTAPCPECRGTGQVG